MLFGQHVKRRRLLLGDMGTFRLNFSAEASIDSGSIYALASLMPKAIQAVVFVLCLYACNLTKVWRLRLGTETTLDKFLGLLPRWIFFCQGRYFQRRSVL